MVMVYLYFIDYNNDKRNKLFMQLWKHLLLRI